MASERDEWVLRVGGPTDSDLTFHLYTKGREPSKEDVEMIRDWVDIWVRALYRESPDA